MRESNLEKSVCRKAKKKGWLCIKLKTENQRGIPDRLFLKNGRVVFIEFKTAGGQLRDLQAEWIRRLENQDLEAYMCDNRVKANQILRLSDD